MSDSGLVKLSEVAQRCGIPVDILKIMASDGLFPQTVRGRAGHVYFPEHEIPTWAACIDLLRERRDRHLRRAAAALRRLETELEAVRNDINDINEAREHPRDALGIDMMSFGHWPHDRATSSLRGQPLITSVLARAVHARTNVHHPLPRRLPRCTGIRGQTTGIRHIMNRALCAARYVLAWRRSAQARVSGALARQFDRKFNVTSTITLLNDLAVRQ